MIRLVNPTTGDILFEGDPNEASKTFHDALRLVPDARLEQIPDEPPAKREPPREVAYAALFVWGILGLVVLACAAGLSVRLFLLISGV